MSKAIQSLLDLRSLKKDTIERIFSESRKAKKGQLAPCAEITTAGLLFFENSTRTQQSFEAACHRAGLKPVTFLAGKGTSTEKGESVEDTVRNIAAMGHELLVIRAGDDVDLAHFSKITGKPVVNAGWGKRGHPTQGLLDIFTVSELRDLKKCRFLFLGDILHSRVAHSNFELLDLFGVEWGVCGPSELIPEKLTGKRFEKLEEGLAWANVIMALRYQAERHETSPEGKFIGYRDRFGLNAERVAKLSKDTLIMHPGPVNKGIEITQEVYDDPRSIILQQVSHGVWLRQAVMTMILSGDLR